MIARLAVPFALLLTLIAAAPTGGWKRFYSQKYRFAVFYPADWAPLDFHGIEPQGEYLDVINFPESERVTGIVIPQSGAELIVAPSRNPGATIDDLVAQSLKFVHDAPSVDQTILTGMTGANECGTLRQVKYHINLGDDLHPVLEHDTVYYCEVHRRILVVTMRYFRGNKDATMLDGIARTAAQTLTVFK